MQLHGMTKIENRAQFCNQCFLTLQVLHGKTLPVDIYETNDKRPMAYDRPEPLAEQYTNCMSACHMTKLHTITRRLPIASNYAG